MALVLANRVKETTTTAGSGTITLAGASTGFQSFAVIGNGNTTYYTIAGQTGNEWEVGIGTYTSSGTILARTTVLANSAGTQPTALSFSAGPKDVFVTYPSEKSVNLNSSGNLVTTGAISSTATGSATDGAGQVYLNGATSNRVEWNDQGTGAPAFTTRSAGTKALLYPAISGSQVDYAVGINAATLWHSIPVSSASFYFKWYGGETQVASLDGTGAFTANTLTPANPVGVTYGGTGLATTTAYSVVFTGTTSTGAFQASAGPGTTGQVLTSNGAAALPTFQTPSVAPSIILENKQTISSSYTVTSGYNGLSVGPVTVASGVTVTVGSGQRWLVL
jgi:hypothetical protein